ncbi:MAG TPA: beta-ketoacyl synthase N-terminal-like domain-containing protein, partial [Ktedonosporobacter sp.]|nr:beta-ketoacyl synthase N-terminal-like domain-containing protein [Ktedonosporobacter sp.]
MSTAATRQVVITGMGLVAPCGIGRQAFWDGMQQEGSYLAPYTAASHSSIISGYAAHVPEEWKAEQYMPRKLLRQTDRYTQFAMAATVLALQDANLHLEHENLERIGVILASTLGGMEFAERELHTLWTRSPRSVSPYQSIAWFYAASQGQITISHGLRGYSKSIVSDRAGGIQALGHAYQAVKEGRADIILAGGSEAPLTPFNMFCYAGADFVNTRAKRAEQAYLPFDREGAGVALGEGAALLVLEEYEHARRRNAPVLAHVSGYATNCEARAPLADYQIHGQKLAQALLHCVEPELTTEPPDYIHADGLALYGADMAEVTALQTYLGKRAHHVPISVPKARIGDAIGAGGAFAAALTVLSLQQQCLLPTPYVAAHRLIADLDFVIGEPRAAVVQHALVVAR